MQTSNIVPLHSRLEVQRPGEWMDNAACAREKVDPETFFMQNQRYAKQVCRRCPVIAQCFNEGKGMPWGVWGGMGARERVGAKSAKPTQWYDDPMQNKRPLLVDDDLETEIVERYVNNPNSSVQSVANLLGISREVVRRVVNQAGAMRHRSQRCTPRKTGTLRTAILALYADNPGITPRQVSEKTGCSVDYAREIRREKSDA